MILETVMEIILLAHEKNAFNVSMLELNARSLSNLFQSELLNKPLEN